MDRSKTLLPDDSLTHEVVELLRELLHALLMTSAPAWIELQLTLPQLRTVFIVAHNKTSSVKQIAHQLGIGEPTASHLVDRLVQAGLVDRREDPEDRRRVLVRPSKAGEELIEKLLGWEELLGGWLHEISEADLSIFRDGLNAIMNVLHGQTENNGHAS